MTTKGKIDHNDAPEGTKAVRHRGKKNYSCNDCEFMGGICPSNDSGAWCSASRRKDGQSVIFIRKEPKC